MKDTITSYFIEIPELDVFSETFPYASFSLAEHTSEIVAATFPSNVMLGKQAEFLFEQLLKQSRHYKLLGATIQIQGATETLGELDYILQNTITDERLHIELACKFYLLDPTLGFTNEEQWIGPNRKDKLLDKLQKLKSKQFPLLYKPETAAVLKNLSISVKSISQKLCLKAFLFLPYEHKTDIPKAYAACIAGTYLRASQYNTLAVDAQYAFPKKKQWLLPPSAIENWVSYAEAIVTIKASLHEKQSPLVYKKTADCIEKIFVVWW